LLSELADLDLNFASYPASTSCVKITPDVDITWQYEDALDTGRTMGQVLVRLQVGAAAKQDGGSPVVCRSHGKHSCRGRGWIYPHGIWNVVDLFIQAEFKAEIFDYKSNTEYYINDIPDAVRVLGIALIIKDFGLEFCLDE
jgi:hypothetical protein